MALVLLGLLEAGCGVALPASTSGGATPAGSDPGSASQRPDRAGITPPTTPAANAPPAGAVPNPRVRQPNPYYSPLAAEALIAFASEYINWNARTVAADMRLLARQSIGQAHSAMELAAGEVARDYELHRGGVANSGRVEGVSPLNEPGGEWVIVTRERTTATASNAYQGLAAQWHVIVAKAVELRPGRWAVSLWQPES